MAEFKWHKMAYERPTNESARYLLLGNGGGLYVGRISTPKSFHIPNHRYGHMMSSQLKAWAEIPEYVAE